MEHTPRQLAEKILFLVKDFSDSEEELQMETSVLAEEIETLLASKYDNLIYYLDYLFME